MLHVNNARFMLVGREYSSTQISKCQLECTNITTLFEGPT